MTSPAAASERLGSLVLRRGASPELEWVEIDGECIVWSHRSQQLHRLDRVASVIFQLCDGQSTVADTVDDLAHSFGVDRQRVDADVADCVRFLLDAGLVTTHRP